MEYFVLAFKTSLCLANLVPAGVINIDPISLIDSLISLFFAAIFGWLITNSYKYSSNSIYGGRQIISSIIPLTLIVCVIITVVKSSLALSLGLVGALSIVRFRTPIKDPEDLIYLFISIVTGLGFGANQNLYTSIGISLILLILAWRSLIKSKRYLKLNHGEEFNLNLEWKSNLEQISVSGIIDILSKTCSEISLIRFDNSKVQKNLILQISLKEMENIENLIKDISILNPEISSQIFNSSIEY